MSATGSVRDAEHFRNVVNREQRSRDKIRQSDGRRPAVTVPGARRETCAASRPTNRAVWLRRAER
ncbi:hypothetical protein J6590_000425 [Homalodisca vitripennis]|nr:hypothetical protein J6590_000425 [Homalodisca vitripennis]